MTHRDSAVSTSEWVTEAAKIPKIKDTKAKQENTNPSFTWLFVEINATLLEFQIVLRFKSSKKATISPYSNTTFPLVQIS